MYFDFRKSQFIKDWDIISQYVEINKNGLAVRRARTSDDNFLVGQTITPIAGTTLSGADDTADWDNGIYTILKGTTEQGITIDVGSGLEQFVKKIVINTIKEESGAFGAIQVFTSIDNTDWIEIEYVQDFNETQNVLYTNFSVGQTMRYIKVLFHGADYDVDKIIIADIQCYAATYYIPFLTVDSLQDMIVDSLSGVTAVINEPTGTTAKIRFQVSKNGIFYYWTGVWSEVGTDVTKYDIYSSPITDLNTHISDLVTSLSTIGLRVILVTDEIATPSIETVTMT
jgi:hypothetical protein